MKQCALKLAQQAVTKTSTLGLTLTVIAVFAGCGKKETPAPTAPAQPPPQAAQPAAAPQQPQVSHPPVAQANAEPDMGELNRAMIRWIVRNKRAPSTFEEFASTAGVQIPPPPAGKKYVIAANKHIQLVNVNQ